MSKLNINRNIFLEREELLRFQQFMLMSPAHKAFLANSSAWGIIDLTDAEVSEDFRVYAGTAPGTFKIPKTSAAMTASGLFIEQPSIDNVAIPNDGNYYWIKIAHKYLKTEEGVVSIASDGSLTGNGTKFTEVLRGQSTEVPTKIKFSDSAGNLSIYEVVDVLDDENAILLGDSFVAESNRSYIVIGSTPIGETITTQQEQGLYFYDSCEMTLVLETSSNTAPAGLVVDEEFWLARVRNVGGTVSVEDKRTDFWEFYVRGVSDKLSRYNNLSDLDDIAEARTNLDVYSKDEVDSLVGLDTLEWTFLIRGAAASATGYNIKLKRVGKMCICQGTFIATTGAQTVGGVVATLAEATLGGTINTDIYFATNGYISGTDNKGLKLRFTASGGVLSIVVDQAVSPANIEYRFNFSFFLDA